MLVDVVYSVPAAVLDRATTGTMSLCARLHSRLGLHTTSVARWLCTLNYCLFRRLVMPYERSPRSFTEHGITMSSRNGIAQTIHPISCIEQSRQTNDNGGRLSRPNYKRLDQDQRQLHIFEDKRPDEVP